MPLSEDEQRILREIEANLHATDPELVQLSETTVYRHAWRAIKWSILGCVLSLVALVATFTINVVFGIVFFMALLACSLVIAHNVRKLGRAGMQSISQNVKGSGSLNTVTKQWRERFRRD